MISASKQILIGTSTFDYYHRQNLCVDSLKKLSKLNSNVECCLIQQILDRKHYDDIRIINRLTRNSSDVFETNKKIPFINDILNVLEEESKDIFVFCNSDIILTQSVIDYINITDVEAFGISRIDISHINLLTDPASIIRMEPSGFDCWVISKKWWKLNKHLFKDFLIGRPYFDVMYTILMLLNSKNLYVSNKHLIFHINHKRAWSDKDECYHYNRLQKELHYNNLEKVWGDCCNSTFLKRTDWGKFLNFLPNESEAILNIKSNYNKEAIS